MRRPMLWMLAGVLLVVAALGFVKFTQIQAAIAGGKLYHPPPETVTSVVASVQEWPTSLDAVGSVAPVKGVTLSADLPGVIDKVEFTSGSHVEQGRVLVTLDTRQERAQLAAAEAQQALTKNNLERATKLFAQQAISQSDFDQATAVARQADAQVQQSTAAIGRKTIRAPFSGLTGIRLVNPGQYVQSGDPIVPLQAPDPMYVNFSVPQQAAAAIRPGATVYASADSGVKARFAGTVTTVNPVVADATRNVDVQATFHNPHGLMRAGMYVTVQVLVGRSVPTISVPASAINYAPYGNSVFVIEPVKGPDGKSYQGVRQQFVKLGRAQGDQVAVIDGLHAGQEIVSSGVFKLRTGAAVVVDNKVQPSNSLTPKPVDS